MTSRTLAFSGAGLLAAALFTPVVTLPIVGSTNLLAYGNYIGIALLVLAALCAGLTFMGRVRDVLWPGTAASALLLYAFIRLQFAISNMQATVQKELAGNPFAGMAQMAVSTVQIQWGWIPLAAGAGLLVYAGVQGHKDEEAPIRPADGAARGILALSVALLLVGPVLDIVRTMTTEPTQTADAGNAVDTPSLTGTSASDDGAASKAEQAAYINQNLRLYDFQARYYDTYSGRTPGVNFKIKNNGNRTLNRVTVRVIFKDAEGKPIAEEEYSPVIVSEYSFGGDNTPLRPNYIYQNEKDKFWTAESVPSEWESGNATATITEIEFAPNA